MKDMKGFIYSFERSSREGSAEWTTDNQQFPYNQNIVICKSFIQIFPVCLQKIGPGSCLDEVCCSVGGVPETCCASQGLRT